MTTPTPRQPTTLIGMRGTSEAGRAVAHSRVKWLGEACNANVGVKQTYGKHKKAGPLQEVSVAFAAPESQRNAQGRAKQSDDESHAGIIHDGAPLTTEATQWLQQRR